MKAIKIQLKEPKFKQNKILNRVINTFNVMLLIILGSFIIYTFAYKQAFKGAFLDCNAVSQQCSYVIPASK